MYNSKQPKKDEANGTAPLWTCEEGPKYYAPQPKTVPDILFGMMACTAGTVPSTFHSRYTCLGIGIRTIG